MNLEEMLKNINPNMLGAVLEKMGKNISPQQMAQVRQILNGGNTGEINQKLNHLSKDDLEQELKSNPALLEQLKKNPEVMAKLQQIFRK